MYSESVVVKNKTGLHARPASLFVQAATRFKADIQVKKGDNTVSSKSIVSLLSLEIKCESVITISANGIDEKEAVNMLVGLVENNFTD